MHDDAVIQGHRERQEELVADSQTILAAADAEKRDLTEEEQATIDANASEFDRLKAEIERRQRIHAQTEALYKPQGRKVEVEQPRAAVRDEDDADERPQASRRPTVPAQARDAGAAGRGGFRSFGDFVAAVKNASVRGGTIDGRLLGAAASTYGNEGSGSDGGFAVPPDYRATIMEKAFGEDSLISRTDRQVSSGNTLVFPSDMTTPWQSSGGIQAYWQGEAAAMTQSKPAIQNVQVTAHKVTALVPVTEELLEDAPAMGGYVARKAGEKIDFKVSNAIAWGNGVGQPLGFMNSNALVTVAIESGPQTADTIVAANIVKMWSRLPVQSRRTAVWLIHPDAEPQLPLMTIGDTPVYMPAGGLSGGMYGSLLGRPVIPHQVCKTVGDLGDIMLVDLASYLTVVKAGGLRSQTSIHLWFDQDLTAFKFTLRVGGMPWWSEATSSLNGSHTMSPFVTLAAR